MTGNTQLLGLALPVDGGLDGTWGDVVNDSITSLVDSAVAGTTTLSADADVTLTTTVLAANQARQAIIRWTASNGATTRNITAPAQSKPYIVINAGTGSIVLRGVGPTTGITIVAGERCVAAWSGSDFVKVATSATTTGTVTSVGGTGTVNGITLTGTVTSSGNLTLGGALSGVSLATQVTGTLPIANGGTGETTRQAAIDALAGAVTSGQYLRGNGTDVVMSAIEAADVPTLNQNTTGSAATLTTGRTIAITGDLAYTSPSFNGSANVTAAGILATVNSNVGSFTNASVTVNGKGLVTAASSGPAPVTSVSGTSPVVSSGGATPAISLASGYGDTQNPYASKTANFVLAAPNGSSGAPTFRAVVAADIPTLNQNTTGTAENVTGTVAFANGGTGETTRQAAIDALAGAVTSGQYLRGNGTDVVMSAIQVADVPTLNQNTTGTSDNVTGTVVVANGGTGATTLTGLVLGNGTSAMTAVTAPSGAVVGTTDTQTLTNKRTTQRIGTVASASTITPTGDTSDQYNVTALAVPATIAAPSGTPTDGQKLVLRLKDNGTARALTWTTSSGAYRAVGVTLPTTTVLSKTLYIGCLYNAADVFWDVVAVAQQA
jgi:hypothetical protein